MNKIIIKGAREHNLKNINIEIPRDKFIVITGLSGSGKSTLAFDTIYAEGQRKYVESLSAYARQFLGLKRDELAVRQMTIIGAGYRHQIFSHPLSIIKSGFLTGTYNGVLFSRRQQSPYEFEFLHGGGIGLALDTMLGSFRAIAGWTEGGRFNHYISVGPSF